MRNSPSVVVVFYGGLALLGAVCLAADNLTPPAPENGLIEMVTVDGGTFMMGSPDGGKRHDENWHEVTLSSFRMGRTPVTQAQYQAVMGTNPSYFKEGPDAPQRPVEVVTWYDAVAFCNKLSEREGLSPAYTIKGATIRDTTVTLNAGATGYRLPTEAEYEYAARGGPRAEGTIYAGSNDPDAVAWSSSNSGRTTHPVATKAPNTLGLYDMTGNVLQWCWDRSGEYPTWAVKDPTGPVGGSPLRTMRGASWHHNVPFFGVDFRSSNLPGNHDDDGGFRVVRSLGAASAAADNLTPPVPENRSIDLVSVDGGTFMMGSPDGGKRHDENWHEVTLSSFRMGRTPVTQAQYQAVMGTNPSYFKEGPDAPQRPVERVTWYDAVAYCNKRSDVEGLSPAYTIKGTIVTLNANASGYRLPTEAEYEYAARGGATPEGTLYAGSNNPDDVAWYSYNSDTIHPVATKAPNALGLYDLSGNVWEWCWDVYGAYLSTAVTDPTGPVSGQNRVIRGGGWGNGSDGVRVANRTFYYPGHAFSNIGFRVVRP